MSATVVKTRIKFGVRPWANRGRMGQWYCEIIAITPRQLCYSLLHAECDADEEDPVGLPAIHAIEDVTLEYAVRMWREHRRDWVPDKRSGAGVKIELNP